MALTKAQRKEIEQQVEDVVTDLLGPLEVEDVEEASEIIRKTVEDELEYIIALQKML